MAFTDVDGVSVLAGPDVYAERRSRWPIDLLRGALGLAVAGVASAPLVALVVLVNGWRAGRHRAGMATLGAAWTLALIALAVLAWAARTSSVMDLAAPRGRALGLLVATVVQPATAFALLPLTARAWVRGLRGRLGAFAAVVAGAHAGLASYLGWWGLVAFRSWTY